MVQHATKKAHEVTFAYLKRWSTKGDKGKPGLWVFDIPHQKLWFSAETGRHSFAVESNLYMALISGARDQSVEQWFSGMESAFIGILKRLDILDFSSRPPARDVGLAVLCAVSFGYRSGFELKEIERLLIEDERFRNLLAANDSPHLAAVENMVNVITREAERYLKAVFLYDLANGLIVCDRPLLVLPGGDEALLPLGPTSVLKLEEEKGATEFRVDFAKANDSSAALVQTINAFTIGRARKWVAGTNREQLERLFPQLTPEAVAQRQSEDRIEFTPPDPNGRKLWWEVRREPGASPATK